jgi:hypothetical protein
MAKRKDVFITAKYKQVLREWVDKAQPGWKTDEKNWSWTEKTEVTNRMKKQKLIDNQVVVNVTKRQVIKNDIGQEGTVPNFWLTWEYFIRNNGKYIYEAMEPLDDRLFKDVMAEVELKKFEAEMITKGQE